MLGHSWPTFSFFLYQFTLPSSLCYEQNFLFLPSVRNAKGAINNVGMTLVFYFFNMDKRSVNSEIENVFSKEKNEIFGFFFKVLDNFKY